MGVITLTYFVLLYRKAEGTVQKRFSFFIFGFLISLIGGAIPDLIAIALEDRLFDLLSIILIALGCVVMFVGFNLKE